MIVCCLSKLRFSLIFDGSMQKYDMNWLGREGHCTVFANKGTDQLGHARSLASFRQSKSKTC